MDTIETLETIAQSQAERRASPEDVLIEMGTFAAGTLAAATGNYPSLGGFDGIRESIRMGAAMLKETANEDVRLYLTGSAERPLTAENLALHTGALWWSAASMLTGDYIALGGYDCAYQRLEMGLAALKEKVHAYSARKKNSAETPGTDGREQENRKTRQR